MTEEGREYRGSVETCDTHFVHRLGSEHKRVSGSLPVGNLKENCVANPKSPIDLLGYVKGKGSKLDRLRAMAKARKRFSMVAPGKTGMPKVLGHREDVLAPSLSDALRTRSEYRYKMGLQPDRVIKVESGAPDYRWEETPEETWLRRRGKAPPW